MYGILILIFQTIISQHNCLIANIRVLILFTWYNLIWTGPPQRHKLKSRFQDKELWSCSEGKGSAGCYINVCFHYFVHPLWSSPSQGHIVSRALHQHMAVRIYRPAANESAPFRASLRRARPIGDAEQDPCLWVVRRCSHVTLGKGMPTWTRGKDAMRVCYGDNTTGERRKHERTHRQSTALLSSTEPPPDCTR